MIQRIQSPVFAAMTTLLVLTFTLATALGQGADNIEFNAVYDCPTSGGYGRMKFKVLSCDENDWCEMWMMNSSPQGGYTDQWERAAIMRYLEKVDTRGKACTVNGRPLTPPAPPKQDPPPQHKPQPPAQQPTPPTFNPPPFNPPPYTPPPPPANPLREPIELNAVYDCPTRGGYGRMRFRVLHCSPDGWCDMWLMNDSPAGGYRDQWTMSAVADYIQTVDIHGKACTVNGRPIKPDTPVQRPPQPPPVYNPPTPVRPTLPPPVAPPVYQPPVTPWPQVPPAQPWTPPPQAQPPMNPWTPPPVQTPPKPPQIPTTPPGVTPPVVKPPNTPQPPATTKPNLPPIPKPEPRPTQPTGPKPGDWVMASPKGDGKYVRCQVKGQVFGTAYSLACNECEGQPPKSYNVSSGNIKPDDPKWEPPVCKAEEKPKEPDTQTCQIQKPPAADNSSNVQPTDTLLKYLVYQDVCGNDPQCGVAFNAFPISRDFINKPGIPGGMLISPALNGVSMTPVKPVSMSVCKGGKKTEETRDYVCYQDPAQGKKWTCRQPTPAPVETCPTLPPTNSATVNDHMSQPFSTAIMVKLIGEELRTMIKLVPGSTLSFQTKDAKSQDAQGRIYGVSATIKTCSPKEDGTIQWQEYQHGFRCFINLTNERWDCLEDPKFK